MMRKLIATLVLIALLGMSTAAVAQAPVAVVYNNFYGRDAGLTTKGAFIERMKSPQRKVVPAALVRLFNEQYGWLGHIDNFDALLEKLSGEEFEVRRCEARVIAYGFYGDEFRAFPRDCRRDEYLLVHKASGARVFSLECGNMLRSPPPPPREACVELPVHLSGGTGGEKAKLHVWSSNPTPGCGLEQAECMDCLDVGLGQPIMFYARIVRATDGVDVVRLPQAMAEGMLKLCVGVEGFTTPNVGDDWIYRPGTSYLVAFHANAHDMRRLREQPLEFQRRSF